MPRIDIQRILLPVDFSEFSTRALEYASAMARYYQASVTALYAHWTPVPSGPYAVTAPQEEAIRDAREELDRFVAGLRATGLAIDTVVMEETPVRAILRRAEEMRADLIVLGTHGRGGFERLVLGSVTEKVLRKAAAPVLTVPRAAETAPAPGPDLFKRILCPVDFSPSSMRALDYALSLAEEADGLVTAMHVIEWVSEDKFVTTHFDLPEHHQRQLTRLPEHQRQLAMAAAERLRAAIPDEARTWAEPEELVTAGRPWHEILRVAERKQAGLIVMGCQGRSAVDLMLFGSTTHHLVRAAPCPVLTLREPASV